MSEPVTIITDKHELRIRVGTGVRDWSWNLYTREDNQCVAGCGSLDLKTTLSDAAMFGFSITFNDE